jgi:hypothetical protein
VTTITSLFAQVRYETLKSAHQRERSRIGCAEIEVDGLGSNPDIPEGRPHRHARESSAGCRKAVELSAGHLDKEMSAMAHPPMPNFRRQVD